MKKILFWLANGFPVWVLAASLIALWQPWIFTWFAGRLITIGLGIIMLGMGLTLTLEDFKRVVKFPAWVGIGMLLQYTVMPLLGWGMSYLFHLPTVFAVGLILVSCCPGGTASNVVNYLAQSDVPLSVTMTAISTILGVVITPLLTALLAGSRIEVNAWGLLADCFCVVIFPVALGIGLNRYAPRFTQKIVPAAPFAAVVFITLIVASIIGAGRDMILRSGPSLLGAVFSLHAGGFFLGYLFSKWMTHHEIVSRTISVEVGMQNSGLGAVLARNNFTDPATAIPSAISSLTHCLIGSFLAALWRFKNMRQERH
ncbi:MAG TPA: bile acid:sodium symporter family protein [Candidatus Omnitrophota bacterium]|nr:bile acid:sodium symporter family protein [Candidatus Omnitrophota bacterium]